MLTPLGKKAKASLQRLYGKEHGTNLFYGLIKTRKRMGYVDGYQIGKPVIRPSQPSADARRMISEMKRLKARKKK